MVAILRSWLENLANNSCHGGVASPVSLVGCALMMEL